MSLTPAGNFKVSSSLNPIFEDAIVSDFVVTTTDNTQSILIGPKGAKSSLNITPSDIKVSKSIYPTEDVAYDLGAPNKRFRDLYLSGNTLHIGDTAISRDSNTGFLQIVDVQTQTLQRIAVDEIQLGPPTVDGKALLLKVDSNVGSLSYVLAEKNSNGELVIPEASAPIPVGLSLCNLYGSDPNIGIGISNPEYTLDVVGDIHIRGEGTLLQNGGAFKVQPCNVVPGEFGAVTDSYHFPGNVSVGNMNTPYIRITKGSTATQVVNGVTSALLTLDTDIIPLSNNTFSLGSQNKTFASVFADSATFNNATCQGNLHVGGVLSKVGGSFDIEHPDPEKAAQGYRLKHCFVESPTRGDNMYRYKVTTQNGKAQVDLPSYFSHLNEDVQVWVSPVNSFGNAYGLVDDACTVVNVFASQDAEYNVLVVGTRKDAAMREYFDEEGGVEYIPRKTA